MNGPQDGSESLTSASAHCLLAGGAMLSEMTKRLEGRGQAAGAYRRKRGQGFTEEMRKKQRKGQRGQRREETRGDRKTLMVGEKRERRKRRDPVLFSPLPPDHPLLSAS